MIKQIAPGVTWLGFNVSGVYLVGEPGGPWTVVDTGAPRPQKQEQAHTHPSEKHQNVEPCDAD